MSHSPELAAQEHHHHGKQRMEEYQLQPTVIPVPHQAPSSVVLASASDGEAAQQQIIELSNALEKVHGQMEQFNTRINKLEEKLNTFSKKTTKPATPAEKKKRNEIRKFFKDKTTREETLLQEITRVGTERDTFPDEQNDPLWKVVKEFQDQSQDTDPFYAYEVLRNYLRHKKKPRKNRLEERRRQRKQRKRNKRSKAFTRIKDQMDKPIYAEIAKYQGFCFDSVLMSSEESEDESTFRVMRLAWRSPVLREVYQELDAIARREMPQSSNLQGEKRRVEAASPSGRNIPTKVLKWPPHVQNIVLDPTFPKPSPAEIKARVENEVEDEDEDEHDPEEQHHEHHEHAHAHAHLEEEESNKRHKKVME